MKKWCCLLLFVFSFSYGQNDTIPKFMGVVAADKMNVVYRGVSNPISIAVPDCKSFTASGPGLSLNDKGTYILRPGQGLESIITLDIVKNDGSKVQEVHKFRIKGISALMGAIDAKYCPNCIVPMNIEELQKARITIELPNFLFELAPIKVTGFNVKIDKKNFHVIGNTFSNEALLQIRKMKVNSLFYITEIRYYIPNSQNTLLSRVNPIVIMVVKKEPEIPYFQSKEFIKDSLQNIKTQKKLERKERIKK